MKITAEPGLFDITLHRLGGDDSEIHCHLTPWDRPVFNANVAAISDLRLGEDKGAEAVFTEFRHWLRDQNVALVSCRLRQDQLRECAFLTARGFRFIEMHFQPSLRRLHRYPAEPSVTVEPAQPEDAAAICAIVEQTDWTGRLSVDPEIDPEFGRRRYLAWATNAFSNPRQTVLKGVRDGEIIGYIILSQPTPQSRSWGLSGISPKVVNSGLGYRFWRSVLAYHHRENVDLVQSGVSSLNEVSFNLHALLGFRFSAPTITLHYCPQGRLSVQG